MKALFTAAALLLSSTTFAASETFVSEPSHTFVQFSYSHFGFSTQTMRFNSSEAKLTLDRAAKTGSAEMTVDMKSVDTGSKLDEHIQDEDFFNTAKFPTATFKSTKVTFDGDKPATIEGNLTIKGVTKPVTFKVTSFHCMPHPFAKKDACGANATAVVKRSEFDMPKYTPHVSDDVTISVAIEAIKP